VPEFELFTKRMVPLTKAPAVTIGKRGTFSLNRAAQAAIGSPETVELLFAKDERIIGIRPVDSEVSHGYRLRPNSAKEDGQHVVTGTSFCRYYDIDTTVSRRWDVTVEDGMLYIDLKSDAVEVTSNRNGRSREKAEAGEASRSEPPGSVRTLG
jgi:hypothetical protein